MKDGCALSGRGVRDGSGVDGCGTDDCMVGGSLGCLAVGHHNGRGVNRSIGGRVNPANDVIESNEWMDVRHLQVE